MSTHGVGKNLKFSKTSSDKAKQKQAFATHKNYKKGLQDIKQTKNRKESDATMAKMYEDHFLRIPHSHLENS